MIPIDCDCEIGIFSKKWIKIGDWSSSAAGWALPLYEADLNLDLGP